MWKTAINYAASSANIEAIVWVKVPGVSDASLSPVPPSGGKGWGAGRLSCGPAGAGKDHGTSPPSDLSGANTCPVGVPR